MAESRLQAPEEGRDGERSPKRRRLSSHGDNKDDDFVPPLKPLQANTRTPRISINSPASTTLDEDSPRPSIDGTDGATPGATPRAHQFAAQNLSVASTPASHRIESDDSYPPSRSSPVPSGGTPHEYPPEVRYRPKYILRGHKRGVSAVKFSPDGKWVASCSADATLRIWSASTGAPKHTLHGHLAGISTLAWAPDSNTVATGSDDKTIRLWNISTGGPQAYTHHDGTKIARGPLLGHHNYVYCVAFSPKGNMLVSSSYDEAVYLWDVRSGALLRSLPAHSDPIGGVDFVRDGTLIASCSSDGLIRVWDTATGQCLRTFFHEDTPPVVSLKFSPNGKYIMAWMLDSCLRMWNYVEGRCVKTYQGHVNQKYSLGGAFGTYGAEKLASDADRMEDDDHDGLGAVVGVKRAFVTSGSEDGSILLWDVVSKTILQKLQGHMGAVLGVDTHPTEKMIVSCSMDKTIRIWKDDGLEALLN